MKWSVGNRSEGRRGGGTSANVGLGNESDLGCAENWFRRFRRVAAASEKGFDARERLCVSVGGSIVGDDDSNDAVADVDKKTLFYDDMKMLSLILALIFLQQKS